MVLSCFRSVAEFGYEDGRRFHLSFVPLHPEPSKSDTGASIISFVVLLVGGLLQYTSVETTGADAHEILRPLCEAALNWLSQNPKLPPLRFSLCLGFPIIRPRKPSQSPKTPKSPKPSTLRPGDPLHSIPSIAPFGLPYRALITMPRRNPRSPQKRAEKARHGEYHVPDLGQELL